MVTSSSFLLTFVSHSRSAGVPACPSFALNAHKQLFIHRKSQSLSRITAFQDKVPHPLTLICVSNVFSFASGKFVSRNIFYEISIYTQEKKKKERIPGNMSSSFLCGNWLKSDRYAPKYWRVQILRQSSISKQEGSISHVPCDRSNYWDIVCSVANFLSLFRCQLALFFFFLIFFYRELSFS